MTPTINPITATTTTTTHHCILSRDAAHAGRVLPYQSPFPPALSCPTILWTMPSCAASATRVWPVLSRICSLTYDPHASVWQMPPPVNLVRGTTGGIMASKVYAGSGWSFLCEGGTSPGSPSAGPIHPATLGACVTRD